MIDRTNWLGAKLATGYKHVELINREFSALVESEDCGVIPDLNAKHGYLSVKVYFRRPISPEWSIHAGEALYQFRSSLDYLACWLAEKNGQTVENDTEFPIFLRKEHFWRDASGYSDAIKKRFGKLALKDQAAIEREQPFHRKDGPPEFDPVWLLYRLSNYDRHQSIHLISTAA